MWDVRYGVLNPKRKVESHLTYPTSITYDTSLLDSEVGSTVEAIYHATVIGDGFLIVAILIADVYLTVFVFLTLLDSAFFAEELDSILKGDARDTLETFDKFQLIKLVPHRVYLFQKIFFTVRFFVKVLGGPEHDPIRLHVTSQQTCETRECFESLVGDTVGIKLTAGLNYEPLGKAVVKHLVDGLPKVFVSVVDKLKLEKIPEKEEIILNSFQVEFKGLFGQDGGGNVGGR
jgi:hypothetical protein